MRAEAHALLVDIKSVTSYHLKSGYGVPLLRWMPNR